MTEGLGHLANAFVGLAAAGPLFNVLWATLLGITVGMMPGLTATLGLALMATGATKEAVTLLAWASGAQPNDMKLRLDYVHALAADGDTGAARASLEALLEETEEFPQRAEAEALLGSLSE